MQLLYFYIFNSWKYEKLFVSLYNFNLKNEYEKIITNYHNVFILWDNISTANIKTTTF